MATDIVEILNTQQMVKICAPMVRYSKLQFRTLVRRYNCDICFTPMILADSFVQSAKARDNEFTTNSFDNPVVVQFAAKTIEDFTSATEMVAPYCDGVDLNCGCPQHWAMKDGYGAEMLKKPELVRDMVRSVKNRIPGPFSVSVKIRLQNDIRNTINLCQVLEKVGVSFLTIHARTPQMRNEPIELEKLKTVRDCVQLPLVANGDVKTLDDAYLLHKESRCEGIMVARGILTNPALFAGYNVTPEECVKDWLGITSIIPTQFSCFHHHLVFMCEKLLTKKHRQIFNNLQSKESVLDFLENYYDLKPNFDIPSVELSKCTYNSLLGSYKKEIDDKETELSDNALGNIFQEL